MNKNAQTYYAIVSVEEGLPEKDDMYYVKCNGLNKNRVQYFTGTKFMHDTADPTHWLSEQQGVLLSVEEWEKVQKCIEEQKKEIESLKEKNIRLRKYLSEYDKDYAKKHGIV